MDPKLKKLVFKTIVFAFSLSLAWWLVKGGYLNNLVSLVLAGLGAAFGDLVIIKFFKEKLSKDVNLVARELQLQKLNHFLNKMKLDFLAPLIGALIVASPLPDEFGLMLLGGSNGILLIVVPANLLP